MWRCVTAYGFQEYIERKRTRYAHTIEHPRYIVYEFEADIHASQHKLHQVGGDVSHTRGKHSYADYLTE